MLGAILGGEGLQGVADLAAGEAGGPVAILLPARGLSARSPESGGANGVPADLEVPVMAGEDQIGSVVVFGNGNGAGPEIDREEIARTAALAAVAGLAVADARDEVEHELRASLVEDLRGGDVEAAETVRRAARLGSDVKAGGIALVAEIRSHKPRAAAALVESEWPGTLAELVGERVYALLPADGGAGGRALGRARALAARIRAHGPAAVSSHYADPGELHLAVREAELVLDVVRRDGRLAEQIEAGSGDGVYRLLFRALISDPGEVRSFYEETVAAVVEYDRQYRGELLGTLDAYLANDCNMNATARAIFAHRHTVAYRLERVRELSGLDPASSTDRERLGLGLKAFRILEPELPR
jgi:sugar diacid utilization regulator